MRIRSTLIVPLIALLAACGSASSPSSVTTAAPAPDPTVSSASPSALESSSAAPAPAPDAPDAPDDLFVDVIDEALAPYADLIGTPAAEAQLGAVLSLHDGDVPLPAGATIVGAGISVREWDDETFDEEQILGLGKALSAKDLESFGGAAPAGWAYNSVSTTDSSSSLVMTRESDQLRLVLMATPKPEPGEPPAQLTLEGETSSVPEPAWISSLPVPDGGELVTVAEGVGQVDISFTPAGGGLISATWRYPVEQLDALVDYLSSGALESAGFVLVDPDGISFGASYIDVSAGDWTGQVIVGETVFDDYSAADLTWYLTRP